MSASLTISSVSVALRSLKHCAILELCALLDECAQRLLDLEAIAEFFHTEYEKIRERYMCHQCEYQYGDTVCRECVEHNKFKAIGGGEPWKLIP